MHLPPNDPANGPVWQFLYEVLPKHWDGRVLLGALGLNWPVGIALALTLMVSNNHFEFAWVHVLLFFSLPVVGFIQFLRDTVTWRDQWRMVVALLFQIFLAALPWFALIGTVIRRQVGGASA